MALLSARVGQMRESKSTVLSGGHGAQGLRKIVAGLRAEIRPREICALYQSRGRRAGKCLEFSCFVTTSFDLGSFRKSLLKVRLMDFLTSTAILPLLFGCVGVFSLFKLLQRMRTNAYLRNAVVVITGATSGLGRGGSWGQCWRGAGGRAPARGKGSSSSAAQVQVSEAGLVTWEREHVTVPGPRAKGESLSAMRNGP